MNIEKIAQAAQRLRDDDAFQHVIAEIESGLAKTLLNAASSDDEVAEARRVVVGLSAIQRRLQGQINAPKIVAAKKGQHRGSD